MPTSKLGRTSPKNKAPAPEPRDFYCIKCGRKYTQQKNNFFPAQSEKYHGNNGYLDACKSCVEEQYFNYYGIYDDVHKAIRRLCMDYNVYYNEEWFDALIKVNNTVSIPNAYFSKVHTSGKGGMTFDDTLVEELAKQSFVVQSPDVIEEWNERLEGNITPEMIEFWGTGFTPEDYVWLDNRYAYWTSRNECETVAQESIFMKICIAEWRINKDAQAGAKIDSLMNAFNNLLDSANLKPKQASNADEKTASQLDKMPLGVGIRKWEDTRPIPELAPEFKDVNGIVRYITIWFLGHLCKMMKIQNSYSQMYEDEMAKYRVERPEYDGDEEEFFDEVFGGESGE